MILVELRNRRVISLDSLYLGRSPRLGAFALGHGLEIIRAITQQIFNDGSGGGSLPAGGHP
jgi:hypothetical protein